jgi:hypothetical protein
MVDAKQVRVLLAVLLARLQRLRPWIVIEEMKLRAKRRRTAKAARTRDWSAALLSKGVDKVDESSVFGPVLRALAGLLFAIRTDRR